jgi:hypothetical protein
MTCIYVVHAYISHVHVYLHTHIYTHTNKQSPTLDLNTCIHTFYAYIHAHLCASQEIGGLRSTSGTPFDQNAVHVHNDIYIHMSMSVYVEARKRGSMRACMYEQQPSSEKDANLWCFFFAYTVGYPSIWMNSSFATLRWRYGFSSSCIHAKWSGK